jgi:mono/diheme cytochrome c family protein
MQQEFLIGFAALTLAAAAHDPVTTGLTWNREVSRIVLAKCASCHRPGGAAFSLLSYSEARPWARAISEEVLERRMPPWGAVNGFGEFRNETALTPRELEAIAQWVDGGAPEGDARDLPPAPAAPSRQSAMRRPLMVLDTDYVLHRPINLDGLAPEVVPEGTSMRITALLPGGAVEPLVWLYRYDMRRRHPFLFRRPLRLPRGSVIQGIAPGARIVLIGH